MTPPKDFRKRPFHARGGPSAGRGRPDQRPDQRQDRRQEPRHESRPDARKDARPEPRPDQRPDARAEPRRDKWRESRREAGPDRRRGFGPARRERRDDGEDDGPIQLYGIHAVEAALRNPDRRFKRLRITDNAARRLADALAGTGLAQESVSPRDLDRLLGPDAVHQGVLLEVEPLPELEVQDLAERAAVGGPIIVLDQVTDPHNVGAVLRSAAVFGASGLVMTRRHSPPPNGTLAKAASGALELVPVLFVQNLARVLGDLKSQGFTLIGLDGTAETAIEDELFDGPIALVLGAEGKGLRQLTRETCDRLVKIGTSGPLASLNVSNAAAVALHLTSMRRKAAKA